LPGDGFKLSVIRLSSLLESFEDAVASICPLD